jgi:hypothetical protein
MKIHLHLHYLPLFTRHLPPLGLAAFGLGSVLIPLGFHSRAATCTTCRMSAPPTPGNMVVNYSERLVTLLKDCRQLIEMGMSVSDKIRAAAADAEKFYRYGVMLKKVRRGVAVLCMTCVECVPTPF